MNINRESINDLNAILRVKIEKGDYEDKVENVLKDYRKKANIKGFRPGMVPIGLIRKMYGKAVRVDEINKLVGESIQKYLTDEKIEILGDPLPKTDEHEVIDFDTQDDFTFSFELGIAPEIELNLSKKNKVNLYEIAVDDKMKNGYVDNYKNRFGDLQNADSSEENDTLKGNIEELDENGNIKSSGISSDNTSFGIDLIKDEEIKKQFIGKKENDTIDFNLRKAFPNETEITSILNKSREEIKDINDNFRFTVREITRFIPAETGPALYNRVYGEDVVKTEEEFMKKIEDEIAANLKHESEYKLLHELKKLVVEKTSAELPEEFLKKWLVKVNNATSEQIDKEFDNFKADLKWQLIKNKVAKDNEIKISEEELQKEAETITRYQFMQYGLYYATDEQITNFAKETLKREEDAKRIAGKLLDDKVLAILRDMVKIESKSVTADEFNKLFES